VEVLYDEGVATHIGPEPCVVVREGRGEASAGERIGQPLSRESNSPRGPPTVCVARKATRRARYRECPSTRRGQRPWHVRTLLAGNREIPRLAAGAVCWRSASGKAMSRSR